MPGWALELLGLWFWGNTAMELRWHADHLELWSLQLGALSDTFSEARDGRVVGTDGYHRGETLHVRRREDGAISHLECATFVYTREPYPRDVPVPGGHPAEGPA